jgi:8-oxo-dGTP pyrophosphatase MutT (NUDIX family)
MSLERHEKGDLYFNKGESWEACISPRILLVGDKGKFPLIKYRVSPWLGLPGGKMKWEEFPEGANALSFGAFPTLVREVEEECGLNIAGYLEGMACLGLAEINIVDNDARQILVSFAPIFVGLAPDLTFKDVSERTHLARLGEHLPGPLFPDARLALAHYERKRGSEEQITPEWLGEERIFFEHRPQVRLLMGPPSWAC